MVGMLGGGSRRGARNSWTRVASLWHTTLGSGHLPGAIPHCQPWTFTLEEESLLWPRWKRPRFYMQRQFCHWSSVSPRTGGQPWQAWPSRGFRIDHISSGFTTHSTLVNESKLLSPSSAEKIWNPHNGYYSFLLMRGFAGDTFTGYLECDTNQAPRFSSHRWCHLDKSPPLAFALIQQEHTMQHK